LPNLYSHLVLRTGFADVLPRVLAGLALAGERAAFFLDERGGDDDLSMEILHGMKLARACSVPHACAGAWLAADQLRDRSAHEVVHVIQSNEANQDQIDGHDKVEQPGYEQNQNAGDECDPRADVCDGRQCHATLPFFAGPA
jgi:hypothetical protein